MKPQMFAFFQLIPVLIATTLLFYLWRYRIRVRTNDTKGYFLVTIIQSGLALSSLSYGIELVTSWLNLKMILVFFRYLGSYMMILGTFFFALWYTGRKQSLKWSRVFFVSLPAGLSLAAIATNNFHHFYYSAVWLIQKSGTPQLAHSNNFFYYLIMVYALSLITATLYILVSCQFKSPRIYGPGIAIITVGYFFMAVGYVLYLGGFRPFGFINLTYYFSTINTVALTLAILRYGIHMFPPLQYEALISKIPIGVIMFDRDMRLVEINQTARCILSLETNENLPGSALTDVDLRSNPVLELCINKRTGVTEISLNGMHLACILSEIHDHLSELAGTLLLIQDVTEHKKAEDALRKSEEKHRQLIENSHDIIYTINPDGIFTFVSAGWTLLLGHPVADIVGKSYRSFVHPDDIERCDKFLNRVIETGQRQTGIEYRVQHADGSWRWHTSNAIPLKNENDEVVGFEGSANDITERMTAEDRLQSLNMDLQKQVEEETERRVAQERLLANQARMAAMGKMIGAIAHQWRQPLSTLGMIVQRFHAMGLQGGLTKEQLDEFKAGAMGQIRYMSDTIEEFRNFYRQEKKRESFEPYICIADAVKLFAHQLAEKNIVVNLVCPEKLRRTVNGYPNEFKQVVLNLLGNARDAIIDCRSASGRPENGCITITIGADIERKVMIIDINDNGKGIPEDIADQIFDPYFTTKENEGGTGIGLYMSRMIMEDSLRGNLRLLQSGQGATFRIELPTGG